MPRLKAILNPRSYARFVRKKLEERRARLEPNFRGVTIHPPGHFYSPLLDIEKLGPDDESVPFDGVEWWEHLDLRPDEQRAYYQDLIERFPPLPFPLQKADGYRFHIDNGWFTFADAFTLSGIIRKEKPSRIMEIGAGFSSAAMLDTLDRTRNTAALVFIEPDPERLYSLLSSGDKHDSKVLVQQVQEVQLSVFDQLEAQDILFIDSSHVAKIGSDVAFIFLRILPRLKRGVLVHFHDVFYPFSCPIGWIRDGRAWNESLFLRAFLIGNPEFQVVLFNSFALHSFPELFRERLPAFLTDPGGSIWIRKVA